MFITLHLTGWSATEVNKLIPFDWETTPIELKTNAARDSGKKLAVDFRTSNQNTGALSVTFNSDAPTYQIGFCSNQIKFDKALPASGEMIWRFTKIRTSDKKIIVQMHCNDKEMVNVELSDTVCPVEMYGGLTWKDYWFKKAEISSRRHRERALQSLHR
jgi:hypothetical protein